MTTSSFFVVRISSLALEGNEQAGLDPKSKQDAGFFSFPENLLLLLLANMLLPAAHSQSCLGTVYWESRWLPCPADGKIVPALESVGGVDLWFYCSRLDRGLHLAWPTPGEAKVGSSIFTWLACIA